MNTFVIKKRNLIFVIFCICVVAILAFKTIITTKEAGHYIERMNVVAQESVLNAFEKINDILPIPQKSVEFGTADLAMKKFYNNLQRLVHLDLKGAPPKSSVYKELFPLFRKLGATGLLIEWEDMFPYTGNISDISAGNAYSLTEIKEILQWAKQNNLTVIPLVQTFGHLEFVLKLKRFIHLRELPNSPLSLSPSTEEAYRVLFTMLEQILSTHIDSKYLHLGCDEVYGLGTGSSGQYMKEHGLDKEDLYLQHVVKMAKHVKSIRPDVTLIIWDDMLRHIAESKLKDSGIGKMVEPMIWTYVPNLGGVKAPAIWSKYGNVFKNAWAASSFKGATGPAQYITEAAYHIKNHINWAQLLKNFGGGENPTIHVNGIALTGWQRYDHFAALCELLPVAIPSLGLCLQTIKTGTFTRDLYKDVGEKLNCKRPLTLDLKVDSKQICDFPGFSVYRGILMYASLQPIENNYFINGWLTPHHVKYNFSSPWHLEGIRKMLVSKFEGFKAVENFLKSALSSWYDDYTVNEWLDSNLRQSVKKYQVLAESLETIMTRKHFPRRPLV